MVDKFIMAGQTPLHIVDTSSGDKCVVLLHGYLESAAVWDEFVPLLSKRARVISLDLPGHGISVVEGECHSMEFLAQTVAAAAATCGVEHYFVAGHSMGGYVALALAESHPSQVEGIILLHSTPYADSAEKRANREREIALLDSGKKENIARIASSNGFADINLRRMHSHIEELRELALLTEDDGIKALLRGMMQRSDKSEFLRSSHTPQLFILGRHDNYITPEVAERMVADNPQAKVVWLENSGHMGYMEEPEKCAEAILEFMGA